MKPCIYWGPEEEEALYSLAGDMPWPMVSKAYNAWAIPRGFCKRTEIALRRRCENLGIQRRSVGEWITSGVICQLMEISYETVRRWINSGWLPARRFGTGRSHSYYIRRTDLRELARRRPNLFGGQSEATLVQILDHEGLAADIAALGLPKPWQPVPVICIEKGRRYPSIGSAARAVYVTPQRLRTVVNTTGTAAGYHWKTA